MSIEQRIREGLHTTNDELPMPDLESGLAAVTAGGRSMPRRGTIAALAAAAAVVDVAWRRFVGRRWPRC